MSYTMEFESKANARPDDSVMEYNGFVIGSISYSMLLIVFAALVECAATSLICTQTYVPITMVTQDLIQKDKYIAHSLFVFLFPI